MTAEQSSIAAALRKVHFVHPSAYERHRGNEEAWRQSCTLVCDALHKHDPTLSCGEFLAACGI